VKTTKQMICPECNKPEEQCDERVRIIEAAKKAIREGWICDNCQMDDPYRQKAEHVVIGYKDGKAFQINILCDDCLRTCRTECANWDEPVTLEVIFSKGDGHNDKR
jgi:hypothetical protein